MCVTISEMAFITAEGEGTIHRGKDLLRVLYVPPYVTKKKGEKRYLRRSPQLHRNPCCNVQAV